MSNEDVVVTSDGDVMTNRGNNADTMIQDNLTGHLTESVEGADDLTGHLTESVGGAEDLTGRYAIEIPGQFPLRLRCVAGRYPSTPSTQPHIFKTYTLYHCSATLDHHRTLSFTLQHHLSAHHTFSSYC